MIKPIPIALLTGGIVLLIVGVSMYDTIRSLNDLFTTPKKEIMKKNIFIIALIGIFSGAVLSGCDKTQDQKLQTTQENLADAKQNVKTASADLIAEWQAFKAQSEQAIAANEKRIDVFKAKMDKVGAKTKAKYAKDVAELERKNTAMKEKLANYKVDGKSNWEEFKVNFNRDMDAIGKTMTDLFKDKSST